MQIASAENPQGAYEAAKARNAADNRAYRERQRELGRASREAEAKERPEPAAVFTEQREVNLRVQPKQEVLPPEPDENERIDHIVGCRHRRGVTRRCGAAFQRMAVTRSGSILCPSRTMSECRFPLAVVGNHKAAPAKKGNGANVGTARPTTLPEQRAEQRGSRQNADNPAPPPHKPSAGTQPLHTEEIPN